MVMITLTIFAENAVFPIGTEAEEPAAGVTHAAPTRLARIVLTHGLVTMLSQPAANKLWLSLLVLYMSSMPYI